MMKVFTRPTSASDFFIEILYRGPPDKSHLWEQNKEVKNKKSDDHVGRVNTFHILQTIRKGPSNFKLCMKRPLGFSNF
jgi:hypothetical protein